MAILCGAAVAAAALAGCGAAVGPSPATDAEVEKVIDFRNQKRWDHYFSQVPPPPVAVVKEMSSQTERTAAVDSCLGRSGVPGVTDDAENGIPFRGGDPQFYGLFLRAEWSCLKQFPLTIDAARPTVIGAKQLDYLYDYYQRRLIPCLELSGRRVLSAPDKMSFLQQSFGEPSWVPYDTVNPRPVGAQQWTALLAQCPLPAFAQPLVPISGRLTLEKLEG